MPDTTPVLTINSINIEGEDYQIEDTVARARADAVALNIYDVGDLFFSMNSTSPAARFGGEWEQLEDVFIRAANDTETGGSDEISITVAQLANHGHDLEVVRDVNTTSNGNYPKASDKSGANSGAGLSSSVVRHTGDSEPFNNMPAYQNVYVWQRVA